MKKNSGLPRVSNRLSTQTACKGCQQMIYTGFLINSNCMHILLKGPIKLDLPLSLTWQRIKESIMSVRGEIENFPEDQYLASQGLLSDDKLLSRGMDFYISSSHK